MPGLRKVTRAGNPASTLAIRPRMMRTVRRVLVILGVAVGVVSGPVAPVAAEQTDGAAAGPGRLVVLAGIGEFGFSGDGGPAREARIVADRISVGRDGSVYLSDEKRVRRVAPDGVIDTVFSARRVGAARALEWLSASAVGPDGSVYVISKVDDGRQLLRAGRTGAVAALADQRTLGAAPDTGDDVAVDDAGNALLYDATHQRVVRVGPAGGVTPVGRKIVLTGTVQLAAGPRGAVYVTEGANGASSEGSVFSLEAAGSWRKVAASGRGPLSGPAVAADGTVYFVDQGLEQVVRINEDGTSAPVSVRLRELGGDLAVGPDGELYLAHGTDRADPNAGTSRILEFTPPGDAAADPNPPAKPGRSAWAGDAPGTVHTIAGTGRPPAARKPSDPVSTERKLGGIAVDAKGTVYVADPASNQVHTITPDGTSRRLAAKLNRPTSVATAPDGGVYLTADGRLYQVDSAGKVSTVDLPQQSEERSTLDKPALVTTDAAGTVYYADYDTIQRLDRGRPVVVVGATPDSFDGPPARAFLLEGPRWIAVGADGSVYFTQKDKDDIQAARPDGALDTVTGGPGFSGDGGPASGALTNHPSGGVVGRDGARYVADTYNNRVRRIDARGTITTVAGTGRRADTGDDGPATKAALTEPTGVAQGPDGTLYVLTSSRKVRAIAPDGTIRTLADLDPPRVRKATDTSFASLDSFAVGPDGTVWVASPSGLHATTPDGELRPVALDVPLSVFARRATAAPPRSGPLAMGPDGSLYLVPDAAVRAYPDGTVAPFLGGGVDGDQPLENWPGPLDYSFRAGDPRDIEIGPDGTVYLSTSYGLHSVGRQGKPTTLLRAEEHGAIGRIALDPDGRLYAIEGSNRVDRVVDSRREEVATVEGAADVAFTSDGTMFVSAGREIRRFAADGASAVVYESDTSAVTKLDVGPNDDLYFLEPAANQVRVLVKPARAPEQSAGSNPLLLSIGGALVVLAAAFLIVRRTRKRTTGAPAQPSAH